MNKIERAEKLAKMRYLYDEQGWTLEEIGEYYGITRQAVHDRFHRAGIKMRAASPRIQSLDRARLVELYEKNPLPLARISDALNTSVYKINQELDRYGIKRRVRQPARKKYATLRQLRIGESRMVEKPEKIKNFYRNLHSKAHSIGIKISVKKVGENSFQVSRIS